MVAPALQFDEAALRRFCEKWQVAELAIFGSALRDDFGPESDVDVLIRFRNEAGPTLFTLTDMQTELARLFSRPVDLLTRRAVEQSSNPIRRQAILSSARVLYAA